MFLFYRVQYYTILMNITKTKKSLTQYMLFQLENLLNKA